jgi:hypothetical protein
MEAAFWSSKVKYFSMWSYTHDMVLNPPLVAVTVWLSYIICKVNFHIFLRLAEYLFFINACFYHVKINISKL